MNEKSDVALSAEEKEKEFRKKCLYEAGIGYSVGAGLIIIVSFLFMLICGAAVSFAKDAETGNAIYPDWYLYLSFLIPQLCLFAAAAIYFFRSKERPTVLFQSCKWYYFPIAIALQLGLLFPVSELNNLFLKGLAAIGYEESPVQIPSLAGWNLLPAILVIAVLPALLEETLFRGILSRNMYASGWGVVPAVLVTGALFSVYHGNPSQTLYQFVSGICLSFIAIKSGSILPTAAAHFLNNTAVLVLETTGYGSTWSMSTGAYAAVLSVASVCFLAALAFLIFFDKKNNRRGAPVYGKQFAFGAAAGIGICAIEWLVTLVTGFMK